MKLHPTFKHFVWDMCEPDAEATVAERRWHAMIMVLILLNVAAVVVGSVPSVVRRWDHWLDLFELFSVVIFSVEYVARVWSCTVESRFSHPLLGRLRYMATPAALIDLLAILPFYITFAKVDLRYMRAFRLVRLARLAKLGRYSEAASLLLRVLRNKREELILTLGLLLTLTVVFASLIFAAESEAQPDKFPDIPHAMWWAIVTITTVGYGDVYPVTTLGKVVGAATALLGILMIALPTGVFGAAFVEELGNRRRSKSGRCCPHCGKEVD